MSATPQDSSQNPIDWFRVKAEQSPNGLTKTNLLRAVDALAQFTGGADISFSIFTEQMIGEWVSRLLFQGYTPKTISNNILKRLATLYNKAVEEGLAEPVSVFRDFQNALDGSRPSAIIPLDYGQAFTWLQSLIRTDFSASPRRQLAKDALLLAISMGGMSLGAIASFCKDDLAGSAEISGEIIARNSRPRCKYLFPLNQTQSTPRQLRHRVAMLLGELTLAPGLSMQPETPGALFALWAAAAMSCGIAASDIAACLPPEHRGSAITAFAVPSPLGDADVARIRRRVASLLSRNPIHWYAMHLRRGVDFDDLTRRLKDCGISLSEIYYPMEEIIRKVGHRKIFENRPVISWLIFFRARVTELDPLFRAIGDLAWGYRLTREVGSPYAVVSRLEITRYQEAIGTLSPATEILPDESVSLSEGDYVVILGGPMNGRHGEFITEKRQRDGASGTKTIYRVRLAGGLNANWIVDRDPRLVRKITEVQFRELDRQLSEALQ